MCTVSVAAGSRSTSSSARSTAEEIAQDFPSLVLPDIYQVIGYYLKHGSELAEYFDRRAREEQKILEAYQEEWSPPGLRPRLLARRKNR